MPTVRENSALARSRDSDGNQLKQALMLTVHRLSSLFRIWYHRSSCVQRVCTFMCKRAKGFVEQRRWLGVCVSVSGTVKCGWNMLIRPIGVCARKSTAVQLESEFQMGREGHALIAGTQGRLLGLNRLMINTEGSGGM